VLADLRELGERCGKNRVARLLRAQGLRARQKRRFRPCTTDSRHPHPIAENWLAKVPAPDRPGLVWQSDFASIETAEGWLFLAFTLDGCTRRCVAHHCRADMRGELTTTTLRLALQRQPPPPGLLHHRDRGSQYAAADFARLATACGLTLSMSRTANPYDNALAESFVATLKTECFGEASRPPARPPNSWLLTTLKPSTTAAAATAPSPTAPRSNSKNKCSPKTKTTTPTNSKNTSKPLSSFRRKITRSLISRPRLLFQLSARAIRE